MLKAEAVDLESFPIYMDFNNPQEVRMLFDQLRVREALNTLDEIHSEEHAMVDRLVGQYLGLTAGEMTEIVQLLKTKIEARTMKAKSG